MTCRGQTVIAGSPVRPRASVPNLVLSGRSRRHFRFTNRRVRGWHTVAWRQRFPGQTRQCFPSFKETRCNRRQMSRRTVILPKIRQNVISPIHGSIILLVAPFLVTRVSLASFTI